LRPFVEFFLTPVLTPDRFAITKLTPARVNEQASLTPTNRCYLDVSIMTDSKVPNPFSKPREDFPLYPHRTGRWAKRVRGKIKYFGKCAEDPKGEAALLLWLDQKDDLLAGRTPRAGREGLTIADLCDQFLQAKDKALQASEITPRTRRDYEETTDRIVAQFGKHRLVSDLASDDFETLRSTIAKTRGPVALGNEIQRVRSVFKFAYDNNLIVQPVRYGSRFKRPSRKVLRLQRAKTGPKMFEAADVRKLIAGATSQLKAMILLAVNCGFGNNDCGTLPQRSLDLDGGWIAFSRPKTGINRRCPLWQETVEALKDVLARRKEPKDESHAGLVFVTKAGGSFSKATDDNPIAKEFAKLAKAQGLQQQGRGFYALRHTFRTIAGGAKDLEATRALMGHVNEHVEDSYIHFQDDARLRAVTDHVDAAGAKAKAKPAEGRSKKPATSKRSRTAVAEAGSPLLRIVG
jgi:integrase